MPEEGFGAPNDANARSISRSSPRRQGFLQFNVRPTSRLELTATLRAVSELAAQSVPSYETLDLRVAWALSESLELSIVGQNLFDDSHPEFGGTPGQVGIPRSGYVKLVWRQ